MSLKHAILGFLSYRPMSGYDLKKAFDGSVQHFWPADQSQIYRTLRQLHKTGAVNREVFDRGEQLDVKIYEITEAGRTELMQWLATPLPFPDDRVPQLIQLYFGAMLDDAQVLALLENQLAQVEESLATFAAIHQMAMQSLEDADPRWAYFTMLTLDYGVTQGYALRAWLTRAIEQIKAGDFSIPTFASLFPDVEKEGE